MFNKKTSEKKLKARLANSWISVATLRDSVQHKTTQNVKHAIQVCWAEHTGAPIWLNAFIWICIYL